MFTGRVPAKWLLFFVALVGLGVGVGLVPELAEAQSRRREVTIQLELGEQRTLPNEGVASFSVGRDGVIIDVRISPAGDLVVVGQQVGTNTLLLLYGDGREVLYRVQVINPTVTSVPARDNIQLDFYFVQLAENYTYSVGLSLPTTVEIEPDIQLDFSSGFTLSAATAGITALPIPRIDLLAGSGWARILRQASIVTSNGRPATFNGGEEVNIIVQNGLTGGFETINAGATVGVTPTYDRTSGRIDIQIDAEMSDLTPGTGDAPGRIVSNVSTFVNLEMGQAIVLGGLVSDSSGATRTGLPPLAQVPILGVLFGRHTYRRQYSQMVLFIIPSIVDTASAEARAQVNEALETYWDFTAGGLDDIGLYDPAGGPNALHPDALESRQRQIDRAAPTPTRPTPSPAAPASDEAAPGSNWRQR